MEANRSFLEKAGTALADITGNNGILQPAQAQRFIRLLVKESKLMNRVTTTPLKAPKQLVNKSRFESRVLRRGQESTALAEADVSKPTFTHVEHDAQLFKAEVRITDEVLEDNIEGDQLRQTIMAQLAERIAYDMDEVIVLSDLASPIDEFAAFDGLLALATSNVVNAGGVTTHKGLFRDAMKTMPSEFLRNKSKFEFFTSVDSELDYRDSLTDRMTQVGDQALAAFGRDQAVVGYSGIPVIDIPAFPENLGGGTNTTNMLLTDPKNIDVGIWRKIKLETDKDIRAGVLFVVATMRFDALYIHEPAVVKVTNVLVGS